MVASRPLVVSFLEEVDSDEKEPKESRVFEEIAREERKFFSVEFMLRSMACVKVAQGKKGWQGIYLLRRLSGKNSGAANGLTFAERGRGGC